MTYRTDSATSPPQGAKRAAAPAPAPGPAPAAPAAPAPMGATAVATHPMVHHQQHLTQTNNVPIPGGYRPAHPQQNGKV